MEKVRGHRLLVDSLKKAGVEAAFFLSGGPMHDVQRQAFAAGIRMVDVRHEQAGVMAAQAYARLTRRAGVCSCGSGPDATNLMTGLANAYIDCVPLVALGGSSPVTAWGKGDFQELDQMRLMEAVTKSRTRVHCAERIPEHVQQAFQRALWGQPGPVYLDLPGDVLYAEVDAGKVEWPAFDLTPPRNPADPDRIRAAMAVLAAARRPIVISGTGALFSGAGEALAAFLDATGIPLFTSPQGRGIVPEDSGRTPITARSAAFREADVVLVVGTRLNYMLNYGQPTRFRPDVKIIQIDTDYVELTRAAHVSVRLQGDAARVLAQLQQALAERPEPLAFDQAWLTAMKAKDQSKLEGARARQLALNQSPIHPQRLCAELAELMPRDAILAVDGHVILNWARQTIPAFMPGRLNSGPFGCLGIGLPFGVGAKIACPDRPVFVLTGDGAFGLNAMELDTAVGHNLPIVVVISNNGGWADEAPERPWRRMGHVRYDLMFAAIGAHGEYVTRPEEIRPALQRAIASGKPACVNVVTDPRVAAETAPFTAYEYA